jgi:hypothetical protein
MAGNIVLISSYLVKSQRTSMQSLSNKQLMLTPFEEAIEFTFGTFWVRKRQSHPSLPPRKTIAAILINNSNTNLHGNKCFYLHPKPNFFSGFNTYIMWFLHQSSHSDLLKPLNDNVRGHLICYRNIKISLRT